MGLAADKIEKAAYILKVVAHPLRLSIVELLGGLDELPVSEICERLGTEQSLTSHHLATMKLKGILACRREGKRMYYSLKAKDITKIFDCLENCECNMV